ncbi:MAG: hypothetical protein ABIQ28_03765 [Gelidibacter sp.]
MDILPNSKYTYVEACHSQKRADFITCYGHALEFYGGVSKAIVSDNLKSAVTRVPAVMRQLSTAASRTLPGTTTV